MVVPPLPPLSIMMGSQPGLGLIWYSDSTAPMGLAKPHMNRSSLSRLGVWRAIEFTNTLAYFATDDMREVETRAILLTCVFKQRSASGLEWESGAEIVPLGFEDIPAMECIFVRDSLGDFEGHKIDGQCNYCY